MSTKRRKFYGTEAPDGEVVQVKDGKATRPTRPIIPFIDGDGIGPEISEATRRIINAAIAKCYGDTRSINWLPAYAGDAAVAKFGTPLPAETLEMLDYYGVGMKGPLGTPTGGGIRSLNVTMRQHFDWFSCVRPVRYFRGIVSVVKRPQDLDVVIFRENTEDVYAGIEFAAGSQGALEIIAVAKKYGHTIREDSGIGIKPISQYASRRIVRAAIEYAIDHGRKVVTLVHKGNIQKETEGAFLKWGLALAAEEFGDIMVSEDDLWKVHGGKLPEGKILLNHRIADATFYELLCKTTQFSVIATTNLNGDYISDAAAGQVGGLGIAPGSNIGAKSAMFEATHGTAPDIAGKGISNPCSLTLSGVMMLEFIVWDEAAVCVTRAIEKTLRSKTATGDLARFMKKGNQVTTVQFADAVIANMVKPTRRTVEAAMKGRKAVTK
jgi:isocitrate dehydrogenase